MAGEKERSLISRYNELEKELAFKTRELAVEAALEQVRIKALAMTDPADMLDICSIICEQLQELGVAEVRNVQTAIIYTEKGIYINYEYYRLYKKTFVTEVEYSHPIQADFVEKMLTPGAQLHVSIEGKELEDWFEYQKNTNQFPDPHLAEASSLNYYWFSIGPVALGISLYAPLSPDGIELFKRFLDVFRLAYQRYKDIEVALGQAKEARIEVALERVRSKAMAMHSSEDLSQTVNAFFKELKALGITPIRCGVGQIDKETRTTSLTTTTSFRQGDSFDVIGKLKQTGHPVLDGIYDHWVLQKEYHPVLKGPDIKAYYDVTKSQIAYPNYSEKVTQYGNNFYFKEGFVFAWTEKELSEEELKIFRRFTSVLSLTYRRYIDLKEAEAQAREAKIEAALEKVRSRSLGMHNTDELQGVVNIVFEKLQELNVEMEGGAAITIFTEGSKDQVHWFAAPDLLSTSTFFRLPYVEHPILSELFDAKEAGADFFAKAYPTDETRSFFKHIFEHSDYKYLSDEIKNMVLGSESYACSTALTKNSGIFITNYAGKLLSEQENDILKRFARVFEQAYTRFLDLQKAEAQARESQIQLALERVRAKTMAMQKSDDLLETSQVLFQQLRDLGETADQLSIAIVNEEEKVFDLFATVYGAPMVRMVKINFDEPFTMGKVYKNWKANKKSFAVEIAGEELRKYNIARNANSDNNYYNEDVGAEDRWIINAASFSKGVLSFSSSKEPTVEATQLLERFAGVFESTFTRFLDLQKAEAQAREAQIETALEKVRSRSMGMQKSDELKEVIQVIYDQFVHLNIGIEHAGFVVDYKPGGAWHFWVADHLGSPAEITVADFDSAWNNGFNEAKEKGIDFFAINLSFDEKNKFYRDLFNHAAGEMPEQTKELIFSKPGLAASTVLLETVGLYIENFSGTPYTNEENATLMRFGKVFQQTYTRFLDLQKAEAQATEARIEASLERVRSRAMAMHKTDELLDAAELLYKELTGLGITSMAVTYSLMDKEEKSALYYSINPVDGKVNPMPMALPHTETQVMRSILASWKKKEISHLIELDEKATLQHQTYIGELILAFFKKHNINIPFSVEAFLEVSPKKAVIYTFNFTQGYIFIIGSTRLTGMQEEIVLRFTKVFELTYRRFLDLKQAEEQARESQIQLALERVRARTMAMQHSDELSETVFILFQQFKSLGENPDQATIGIINEEEHVIEYWVTMHGNQTNRVFRFSIDEPDVTLKIYKGWKEKKKSIVIDLTGKALHDFTAYRAGMGGAPAKKGEKRRIINVAFFSKGLINVQSNEERSGQSLRLLERFAAVFDSTYRRFLDLQQAEAQAREAQIQLALERVRARTMAMQKSDELTETSYVLFEQFKELGANAEQVSIGIFNEEEGIVEVSGTLRGIQFPQTFTALIDEPFVMGKIYKGWKSGKKSMVIEMAGQELHNYNKYRNKVSGLQFNIKEESHTDRYVINCAFFSKGVLSSSASDNAPIQTINLLERFAAVFDGIYTRFLDLKQAEAQAREARIEAALERVRSKTMAMHNSGDIGETVAVMFDQLVTLGVETTVRCGVAILYDTKHMEVWTASSDADNKVSLIIGRLDTTIHPMLEKMHEAWENKESNFSYELVGEDIKNYYRAIIASPEYHFNHTLESIPPRQICNIFFFPEGALFAFTTEPFSPEATQLFKRFAGVFGLTYRRFLDLQKAEAQAREAQIETALERVRSRTMTMQTSDELAETSVEVFKQLISLGIEPNRLFTGIIKDDGGDIELWATDGDGSKISTRFTGNINRNNSLKKMYLGWKEQKKSITVDMHGKILKDYFHYLGDELKVPFRLGLSQKRRVQLIAYFSQGFIGMASPDMQPVETTKLLERFAGVFNLTYTRFNDLKLAEAQARESQIEAALERVRGRAMAMHNSNDLSSAASVVFTELRKLGINPIRCGVGLLNKESRKARLYSATTSNSNDALALIGWVELSGHPVLEKIYQSWLDHENYFPVLNGEQLKNYYGLLLSGLHLPAVPGGAADEQQYGHFLQFPEGCLYAWAERPYDEAEIKILDRFKGIISLTFRRYMELQKSEANARDAIREASLDRVRAEIASMRTTSDLERITPLVWNELTTLGVPFIRCGVFIVDEAAELVHYYLSTPDGNALASFKLPFEAPGIGQNVLLNWRAKQVFKIHWNEAEFTAYTKNLVEQGAVKSEEKYVTAHPPTSLDLHFFPFLQGMLYVGNVDQLGHDELNLVQSLADAFSTAYARYEDFNKLEAAKQQVDNTLTELKAAQTKLIQSEKMASLGELTAGIAHEIQNPLNFVNNFSEVNQEMIDELQEELRAGNIEDALAIAADIKQNEEKINHHGKRADGIVKGMLQHSRTSSGEKQLTNINVLADEFMRLSYHGLRAKDKTFNAEMVTYFDPNLPKINVIPQDIGRVMLNLFNNAFYAVSQKQKSAKPGYKPEVSVTTSIENGQAIVKVTDNGTGIPEAIKEKIMQPFFTTKPTGEGTGLGLSLTYDMVVKGHGGSIKVNSVEGERSEFIISLPIK